MCRRWREGEFVKVPTSTDLEGQDKVCYLSGIGKHRKDRAEEAPQQDGNEQHDGMCKANKWHRHRSVCLGSVAGGVCSGGV